MELPDILFDKPISHVPIFAFHDVYHATANHEML